MSKVLWVSPDGDRWKVQIEGSGMALRTFNVKEDAIKYARGLVRQSGPGEYRQIKVQRKDGTIETEWTYGKDPYPPAG